MDKWMVKVLTAPDVEEAIKCILLSWKHGERSSAPYSDLPGFVEAFQAQECIGWQAFLEGCISTLWREVQDQHKNWLGMQCTGQQWAIVLIKSVLGSVGLMGNRNKVLHEEGRVESLLNILQIYCEICWEFLTGLLDLPVCQQLYVTMTYEELMQMTPDFRCEWFQKLISAQRRTKKQ